MKELRETISVRLNRETIEYIEKVATHEGGKRGAIIRRLVLDGVRRMRIDEKIKG